MSKWSRHPVVMLAAGIVLGYMFSAQVQKVPGVSKLPKV
jgi:hypothetical protein